jgi:hypothetical protein
MKLRSLLAVVCTAVLAGVGAGAAGAATGPRLLQKRAEEQTRLLFAQLRGPQVASPHLQRRTVAVGDGGRVHHAHAQLQLRR